MACRATVFLCSASAFGASRGKSSLKHCSMCCAYVDAFVFAPHEQHKDLLDGVPGCFEQIPRPVFST